MAFVSVKFRPEDTRTYTYEWDGEALSPGDEVKVADNRSDGWKRVTVVSTTDKAPDFACKPILGRAPPPEPKAGLVEATEQWSHDIDPQEIF